MVEKLHVPKEWVCYGKAQRAGYEEWHDLQALHMLSAGRWNGAHSVIMENLAVDAIINGKGQLNFAPYSYPHAHHIR